MEWVQLSSIDAIGDPSYTFEASTLFDFTDIMKIIIHYSLMVKMIT